MPHVRSGAALGSYLVEGASLNLQRHSELVSSIWCWPLTSSDLYSDLALLLLVAGSDAGTSHQVLSMRICMHSPTREPPVRYAGREIGPCDLFLTSALLLVPVIKRTGSATKLLIQSLLRILVALAVT